MVEVGLLVAIEVHGQVGREVPVVLVVQHIASATAPTHRPQAVGQAIQVPLHPGSVSALELFVVCACILVGSFGFGPLVVLLARYSVQSCDLFPGGVLEVHLVVEVGLLVELEGGDHVRQGLLAVLVASHLVFVVAGTHQPNSAGLVIQVPLLGLCCLWGPPCLHPPIGGDVLPLDGVLQVRLLVEMGILVSHLVCVLVGQGGPVVLVVRDFAHTSGDPSLAVQSCSISGPAVVPGGSPGPLAVFGVGHFVGFGQDLEGQVEGLSPAR